MRDYPRRNLRPALMASLLGMMLFLIPALPAYAAIDDMVDPQFFQQAEDACKQKIQKQVDDANKKIKNPNKVDEVAKTEDMRKKAAQKYGNNISPGPAQQAFQIFSADSSMLMSLIGKFFGNFMPGAGGAASQDQYVKFDANDCKPQKRKSDGGDKRQDPRPLDSSECTGMYDCQK